MCIRDSLPPAPPKVAAPPSHRVINLAPPDAAGLSSPRAATTARLRSVQPKTPSATSMACRGISEKERTLPRWEYSQLYSSSVIRPAAMLAFLRGSVCCPTPLRCSSL
eukprot:6685931-Prymnesium_polylepis.1